MLKTIYGPLQGNKRMQCVSLGEFCGFPVWRIAKESDTYEQAICLERNGLLYRVCSNWAYSQGKLNEIQDIETHITTIVEKCLDTLKRTGNGNCNLILAGFVGRFDEAHTLIVARDEKRKAESEAKYLAEYNKKIEEDAQHIASIRAKLIATETITGCELVKLADVIDLPIPPRTKGWLLDSGVEFHNGGYRMNRGFSKSNTAYGIYRSALELVQPVNEEPHDPEIERLFKTPSNEV